MAMGIREVARAHTLEVLPERRLGEQPVDPSAYRIGSISLPIAHHADAMMHDTRGVATHIGLEPAVDEHGDASADAFLDGAHATVRHGNIGVPQDLHLGCPAQQVSVRGNLTQARRQFTVAQAKHEIPIPATSDRLQKVFQENVSGREEGTESGINNLALASGTAASLEELRQAASNVVRDTMIDSTFEDQRTEVADAMTWGVRKIELVRVDTQRRQSSVRERQGPLRKVCLVGEVETGVHGQTA